MSGFDSRSLLASACIFPVRVCHSVCSPGSDRFVPERTRWAAPELCVEFIAVDRGGNSSCCGRVTDHCTGCSGSGRNSQRWRCSRSHSAGFGKCVFAIRTVSESTARCAQESGGSGDVYFAGAAFNGAIHRSAASSPLVPSRVLFSVPAISCFWCGGVVVWWCGVTV